MILLKPDHSKRVSIPAVLDPVSRPVDVDASRTGFTYLRTLRIYQFDKGSDFEGHAEEDEVFVIILSGTIELTITAADSTSAMGPSKLSALDISHSHACAAYLAPGSAYHLTASSTAEVAYARATPLKSNASRLFFRTAQAQDPGINHLWEETTYAGRLRVRLLRIDAFENDVTFTPMCEVETGCEGLVHLRTTSPAATAWLLHPLEEKPLHIASGDTIALAPAQRISVKCPKGSLSLVLIVFAAGDGNAASDASTT